MNQPWVIRVFRISRTRKRILQIIADTILMTISFVLAMFLRLEDWGFVLDSRVWMALWITLPVSLSVFIRVGFYRAIIRYISGRAFRVIVLGTGFSSMFLLFISQVLDLHVPRSTALIYWLLAFIQLGSVRFALRSIFYNIQNKSKKRVLIYGAGAAGRQLMDYFKSYSEFVPVGFLDDARELQGHHIQGLEVYPGKESASLVHTLNVKEILLAMPSVTGALRKEILKKLESLPVHVRTVPRLSDVISGQAKLNEIREIAIEDLLGRDAVLPDKDLLQSRVKDKIVMVSGAGGSIGSELCRQIIRQMPAKLILFEISEFSLYRCEKELNLICRNENNPVSIISVLGSVQDKERVYSALKSYQVQTIFHAAAYKHVPIVEQNIVEGIRNNVFGTLSIVEAAIETHAESFILISTDKAVRPTNFMGASKRMAELICQAHVSAQSGTVISMVRFGNVLGSSGSVIPLFREQIDQGGPITVTHPEITRYFMTIPEASQLVIQANAMARGGEVFVLNMGDSVKILDLAVKMVKLHGLNPKIKYDNKSTGEVLTSGGSLKDHEPEFTKDISIVFSGLRPGEKLYEELLISGNPRQSDHPLIFVANEQYLEIEPLKKLLSQLESACTTHNIPDIVRIFEEAGTGYVPANHTLAI